LLDQTTGLSHGEIPGVDGQVVITGIVNIKPVEVSKVMGTGSVMFRNISRSFFRIKAQSLGNALDSKV
jgi:hypothetical protein